MNPFERKIEVYFWSRASQSFLEIQAPSGTFAKKSNNSQKPPINRIPEKILRNILTEGLSSIIWVSVFWSNFDSFRRVVDFCKWVGRGGPLKSPSYLRNFFRGGCGKEEKFITCTFLPSILLLCWTILCWKETV